MARSSIVVGVLGALGLGLGLRLVACDAGPVAAPAAPIVIDKIALPGTQVMASGASNPTTTLAPSEGTLEIRRLGLDEGERAARAPSNDRHISMLVKVTPGAGYHVSTEFPTRLTLDVPAGVTLDKTMFEAGSGFKGTPRCSRTRRSRSRSSARSTNAGCTTSPAC